MPFLPPNQQRQSTEGNAVSNNKVQIVFANIRMMIISKTGLNTVQCVPLFRSWRLRHETHVTSEWQTTTCEFTAQNQSFRKRWTEFASLSMANNQKLDVGPTLARPAAPLVVCDQQISYTSYRTLTPSTECHRNSILWSSIWQYSTNPANLVKMLGRC